jgi:hypothetical protein
MVQAQAGLKLLVALHQNREITLRLKKDYRGSMFVFAEE